MGRVQRAATIRPSLMMTAPSCRGEFLKNRFIRSRRLTMLSIRSPVSMIYSSEILWGRTIRAPVLLSDMDRQASVISLTNSLSIPFSLMPRSLPRKDWLVRASLWAPRRLRKWRISGWKITISASTPTSMNVPSRALISCMLKAATTTRRRNRIIRAMKMFIAADPRIHRNAR